MKIEWESFGVPYFTGIPTDSYFIVYAWIREEAEKLYVNLTSGIPQY
jgi:hypothetical protein